MKNDVVNNSVYEKLVVKVNNKGFVLKTKYDTDKLELEKKISYNSGLVKKLHYSAKVTELEKKIPSISSLATTSALTKIT